MNPKFAHPRICAKYEDLAGVICAGENGNKAQQNFNKYYTI